MYCNELDYPQYVDCCNKTTDDDYNYHSGPDSSLDQSLDSSSSSDSGLDSGSKSESGSDSDANSYADSTSSNYGNFTIPEEYHNYYGYGGNARKRRADDQACDCNNECCDSCNDLDTVNLAG